MGQPISGPLLCEKALLFNQELSGNSDFKASTGWLRAFKSRHRIRELQIEGETLSGDSNAANTFTNLFLNLVQKEGYTRDDVYNADETEINWRALPKKSLAARKEATAPGFKTSKERITAMVCANASGNHILPLLVIGKAKKPRCFKNVVCFPTTYKSQKSAWMNLQVFIDWYTNDFIPQVKRQREQEGRNGKVLLVLDNAPSHPSEDTLNEIESCFRVMFLPPNVTALIQPMDQGVIEKLKRLYRKQVLRRLLLVENESNDNVVNFSKTINLKDACFMLADALDSLTKQNVMNAWKKLWLIAEELQQQRTVANI